MQTFLPYEDFAKSASVLDVKRLGKQRVETLQIMQVLLQERLITSDVITWEVEGIDEEGAPIQVTRSKKIPRPRETWEREVLLPKGWKHHPAVRMWRGHELALLEYQRAMCNEWTSRGYSDSCLEKTEYLVAPHADGLSATLPALLTDEKFHESHRSNLLRKDETFYRPLFEEGLPADLDYIWPAADPTS